MPGFSQLLGGISWSRAVPPSTCAAPQSHAPQSHAPVAAETLVYPPVDPGIPARAVDELLATQQALIDRIKVCYGVDRPTFEQEILALVRRYAECVHLLPATADNYFNVPGGLLRMGLEVAFFSLQGTDGHIFSGRSTISVRRQLEPRWRHATFIAGLCCEIHRTLSHVIVTDERGEEWQPYVHPLSRWLAQQNATRFFLKWRPNVHESRSLGVFVLPHVIPETVLQHLAAGNDVIVPHMMASISGMPLYREHNILDDLVRRSVALVVDRYLRASADRYGTPQLGSHLERYLVDALRRLIAANSAWQPNGEKSRIWFGTDGLFLVWPNAATEIRKLLEADQLPGIPKAPETILEILVAAGVFEPQSASQATWPIMPPKIEGAIEAVKLSSPAILFAGLDAPPKPLDIALVRCAAGGTVAAPASPPDVTGAPESTESKPRVPKQLPLPIEPDGAAAGQGVTESPPDVEKPSASGDVPSPAAPLAPEGAAAATLEPARSSFKLDAPIRLNPAIREVLAQIVDTLNGKAVDASACTVSNGVFIPLSEFARRKIEPPLALRALAELKMLVQPKGERGQTLSREFGGEPTVGLLLDPRFVAGFDPNHFDLSGGGGSPPC